MDLISLPGTDDRLYNLVSRLVMDADVLRYNNNYPFKTSPDYTWHVCLQDGEVMGFMPVKNTARGLYVDNYYIKDDDSGILDALIGSVVSSTDSAVTALVHKRHADVFHSHGFIICTVFAQYNKMQVPGRKGALPA